MGQLTIYDYTVDCCILRGEIKHLSQLSRVHSSQRAMKPDTAQCHFSAAMDNKHLIHTAINRGYFQQVRFHIDKGCDVNIRDQKGKTPLILCAYVNDNKWSVGLARLLIENGARISKCDQDGYNALHHACINQKPDLVDVYLSALDCDVHSKCKKGNTSLHYAASLGNRSIVSSLAQLVLRYKLSLDPKNKKGCTPLHQAFKANQIDCGDLLMKYGANEAITDNENKTGTMLRQESMERLDLISTLSQERKALKTVRELKHQADSEQPKPKPIAIQKARDNDLRNDPEYVFKVSAVNYFQRKTQNPSSRVRPRTAPEKRDKGGKSAWKEEILQLWSHYETQCSKSFRKPATPSDDITAASLYGRNSVFSSRGSPPLTRRSSRISITGASSRRSGSVTQDTTASGGIRRTSNSRKHGAGMPPLVRTQSRASFNHTVFT